MAVFPVGESGIVLGIVFAAAVSSELVAWALPVRDENRPPKE
jgi:hypothetical protein